jgi:hypothetical protein
MSKKRCSTFSAASGMNKPGTKSAALLSALVSISLCLSVMPVRADQLKDDYLAILKLIYTADQQSTNESSLNFALTNYSRAQSSLAEVQWNSPNWQPQMIAYRLSYVGERISALTNRSAALALEAPATKPAKVSKAVVDSAATTFSAPQVRLLSAGAEPRQALRLHLKAGDTGSYQMGVSMDMKLAMAGAEMPTPKMPGMKVQFEVNVVSVGADGAATVVATVKDAGVTEGAADAGPAAAAMTGLFEKMKGASQTNFVSARGLRVMEAAAAKSANDPMLGQTMDQMMGGFDAAMVGLPEEAVGAGAKWEVQTVSKSQGLKVKNTQTIELVSVEGDKVSLKISTVQQAGKQTMQNPMVPGGKLELAKLEGSGSGEATLDLGRMLPAKSTAEQQTDMAMSMNVGGQSQTMSLKNNVKVTLEAK